MADAEKSKRKVWTRDETLLFLSCYRAHKEEFEHPRKKRGAYANVLEDIICLGFYNVNVNVLALEGNMRTLLFAYKCAKDNAKQMGAGPCIAPYLAEMDEIYGDKPIISNVHSLNFGQSPTAALVEPHHLREFAGEFRGNNFFLAIV